MNDLERAIIFATEAHAGQLDGCGAPYILHSVSVALRVARDCGSEYMQIAAVLHDVVEDGKRDGKPVEINDVDHHFGWKVAEIVEALTHVAGESYQAYIERVCKNQAAIVVKLADIDDHFDPRRAAGLTGSMRARYNTARAMLRAAEGRPGSQQGGVDEAP